MTASRSAGSVSGAVSCHSSPSLTPAVATTWPAGPRTSTALTSFRSNARSVRSRNSLGGFWASFSKPSGTRRTAGFPPSCA